MIDAGLSDGRIRSLAILITVTMSVQIFLTYIHAFVYIERDKAREREEESVPEKCIERKLCVERQSKE